MLIPSSLLPSPPPTLIQTKTRPETPPANPQKNNALPLSLLPHKPIYLSATPYRKSTETPPVTRDSRIKSAWFTPSAGRGLSQPPFWTVISGREAHTASSHEQDESMLESWARQNGVRKAQRDLRRKMSPETDTADNKGMRYHPQ